MLDGDERRRSDRPGPSGVGVTIRLCGIRRRLRCRSRAIPGLRALDSEVLACAWVIDRGASGFRGPYQSARCHLLNGAGQCHWRAVDRWRASANCASLASSGLSGGAGSPAPFRPNASVHSACDIAINSVAQSVKVREHSLDRRGGWTWAYSRTFSRSAANRSTRSCFALSDAIPSRISENRPE